MNKALILLLSGLWTPAFWSQDPPIHNVYHRPTTSLNGNWHILVDPYETGYRNNRTWRPFDEGEAGADSVDPYWANRKMENSWDRIEYDFDQAPTLMVPGDWNSQDPRLLYYEGTLWYQTDFDYALAPGRRLFLRFGAVNYEADVYLNGRKVGKHRGGFDPFNFEVTERVEAGKNVLIVRADNRREPDRVPGLTTDWWNYGGITRDVGLVEVPATFIQDYALQLDREDSRTLRGWVQLNGVHARQKVTVSVPEASLSRTLATDENGFAVIELDAPGIDKWYPERPKLYDVTLRTEDDEVSDRIGFRTIRTEGTEILLNDQPIFLRGISLHEEVPQRMGRANSLEDARLLLGWAKELNCNFVRLAHYPHNEHMPRLADEMGLMLWEEIPVYWGIHYEIDETAQQAESQLRALVGRDKNRASVIVWSVANETNPEEPGRLAFLENLAATARRLDPTRLVSAALERTEQNDGVVTINDPFARTADLMSCNEYIGWYGSTPDRCAKMKWDLEAHQKPFFVSEFGAGALYNHHGDRWTRWTEEYQAWMYEETIQMLRKIPSLRGMSPWILVDFRSPRRNLPGIQDGWNRKGLISNQGFKKKAFYVLRAFYQEMAKRHAYEIR